MDLASTATGIVSVLCAVSVLVAAAVTTGSAGRGRGLLWVGAIAFAVLLVSRPLQGWLFWRLYRSAFPNAEYLPSVGSSVFSTLLIVVGTIALVLAAARAGRGTSGFGTPPSAMYPPGGWQPPAQGYGYPPPPPTAPGPYA